MEYLYGALADIAIFSLIGTIMVIVTEEDEVIAMWYLTNIFGLISLGVSYLFTKIKKFIKGRKIKSIIKIKATDKTVYCDFKYFDDFSWTNKYEQIKIYAKKDEWGKLEKIDKITLQDALRNCDRCKYNKGCHYSGNDSMCEFSREGNIDNFKHFERK